MRGLQHMSYGEGTGMVQSGEEEARGDLVTPYNCLRGGCGEEWP